jgi:hypothetical protein
MGFAFQAVERAPQHRRVRHLVVSRGGDHEHGPGLNAASEEAEEPEAHLVGPVEVLQHQQHGRPGREVAHELGDALEDPQVIGRPDWDTTPPGAQLRKEPRKVGLPGGATRPLAAPGACHSAY